ncbi:MAG: DUF805 domain-containing protein, partial [Victivallaceae bacterium]|nr:DUF805 domain-containing protein [Victivallaceae bacterium]
TYYVMRNCIRTLWPGPADVEELTEMLPALIMICANIGTIYWGIGRLHDTGRSAWNILWIFFPVVGTIVLLVFFLQKGTPGANRFGAPPLSKK